MSAVENFLDPDIAYFLGLVVARGSLQENPDRRLVIEFPYSNLIVEGVGTSYDQDDQLQLGIGAIRDRLGELLDTKVTAIKERRSIKLLRNGQNFRKVRAGHLPLCD